MLQNNAEKVCKGIEDGNAQQTWDSMFYQQTSNYVLLKKVAIYQCLYADGFDLFYWVAAEYCLSSY